MHTRRQSALLAGLFIAASVAHAAEQPTDLFLGDWQGDELVAQVIPRGNGNYQINLLPQFDAKVEPLAVVQGHAADGTLTFDQDDWLGKAKGEQLNGSRPQDGEPVPFKLQKVSRPSPRVGSRPPEGAIVLFDGTGFGEWEVHRGRLPTPKIVWELVDDSMRVAPIDPKTQAGHSLVTKRRFIDFRFHLEFRLPLMADKTGQARANGGVAFEDANWYELQILDSYGLEGLDNECGGLYKIAAPAVNMCRPPLMWQSYDVEFHSPRYDDAGNRTKPGCISVNHNGVQIHKDVQLPDSDKASKRRKADPAAVSSGRIILHHHKNPIQYRNIWVEEQ